MALLDGRLILPVEKAAVEVRVGGLAHPFPPSLIEAAPPFVVFKGWGTTDARSERYALGERAPVLMNEQRPALLKILERQTFPARAVGWPTL